MTRAWIHRQLPFMCVAISHALLDDMWADRLEERGALDYAMKLRNREEPAFDDKRRSF